VSVVEDNIQSRSDRYSMSEGQDTVELPANSDVKQLAHDVVREENEYAVPIILDTYDLLSKLDEEEPLRVNDASVDDPRSELEVSQWSEFLELLNQKGIIETTDRSLSEYVLSEE